MTAPFDPLLDLLDEARLTPPLDLGSALEALPALSAWHLRLTSSWWLGASDAAGSGVGSLACASSRSTSPRCSCR
jgi:hypothetical protein